jgi:type II secretory pathway pseudopilin PulG
MKFVMNQNGFTYILALTVIMIMGIMLGMVGQSWKTIKQRELEEEMIFRGDQIAELVYQKLLCKNANLSQATVNQFLWTASSPNGTVLDDLIIGKEERCTNRTTKQFRLRASAAIDPMTIKQWQIVKPVGDPTRFSGVASESIEEPFRKSFKSMYDSKLLDDKKQYSDWQFTWELKNPVQQAAQAPQVPKTGP